MRAIATVICRIVVVDRHHGRCRELVANDVATRRNCQCGGTRARGALALSSVVQVRIWRDNETFFRTLYEAVGDSGYRADIAMRLGDFLRTAESGRRSHSVLSAIAAAHPEQPSSRDSPPWTRQDRTCHRNAGRRRQTITKRRYNLIRNSPRRAVRSGITPGASHAHRSRDGVEAREPGKFPKAVTGGGPATALTLEHAGQPDGRAAWRHVARRPRERNLPRARLQPGSLARSPDSQPATPPTACGGFSLR